jgi:hypothetical protein
MPLAGLPISRARTRCALHAFCLLLVTLCTATPVAAQATSRSE